MTTAAEIGLRAARIVTDVMDGTATTGSTNSLTDTVNLIQPNAHWDRGTLFILSGTHSGKVMKVNGYVSNRLSFDPLASVLCVHQVETATVVGTVTGDGNATVIITAAGMNNSPKTLSVAVINLDTASAVGGKIRTAMNAESDITNYFTVGGSGATITLTPKIAVANDTTLNICIDNGTCTGLTAAPTSANTTAGVAGPRYAVIRGVYPWTQVLSAIQEALDMTHVTGVDSTLLGDGETINFTLPAGVYNLKIIRFTRDTTSWLVSNHWREFGGQLRFDPYYAPVDGDTIDIVYRKPHDAITAYSTTINAEIDTDWLTYKTAENLLWWALGNYGSSAEYRIEERMNRVMAALKGKAARRDGPDIVLKTSGVYI